MYTGGESHSLVVHCRLLTDCKYVIMTTLYLRDHFLQMLNLDLLGNSEGRRTLVNSEAIHQALGQVPDSQRAFIEFCLQEDPAKRPKASTLLKHPVLQEVHTRSYLRVCVTVCVFLDIHIEGAVHSCAESARI